jgi:adenylylsulfate reductase subunit B
MAAEIDYTKCNGCGKCYDLCPMDVITWNQEQDIPEITYPEDCWFCGVCWMECPKRAIDILYPACFW